MSEEIALYVHWPFCKSKCPYCDFNSHVRAGIEDARWRSALLRELDHYGAKTRGRRLVSVFFGGGTPSLMAPATVAAAPRARRALLAGRTRSRSDARGQPDLGRGAAPRRFQRRRRQPRLARRAGARRPRARIPRPRPRRRRGARRRRRRRAELRALFVRPHLRASGPRRRRVAARARRGARAGGRSPVALPAHDRAGHRVSTRRMRAAISRCRTTSSPDRSTRRRRSGSCAPAFPLTRSRTTRGRARNAGTISSIGARMIMSASAPARTAASAPAARATPRASAARRNPGSPPSKSRATRPRRACPWARANGARNS